MNAYVEKEGEREERRIWDVARTRFSIRSINSTHRNQGVKRELWNSLGGTQKLDEYPVILGADWKPRIRHEIEKFTPDSHGGFYRGQDGRIVKRAN